MTTAGGVAGVLVLGLIAGVLSGMFGIGGGLVIVPALIILFGVPDKTAIGTSLFALMWPVGLLGVLRYWRRGEVLAPEGVVIAVAMLFGAYAGAGITGALAPATVKRIYGTFLVVVGLYFLWTSASPAPKAASIAAPSPSRPTAGGQVH
jgi:uncharacterized protein